MNLKYSQTLLHYALALAAALMLVLMHPDADLSWLAPVALTPLLIAVARENGWRRRFLLGYATGVVYWFGVCYWIQYVLAVFGGVGEAGGWASFLLFCLAKAVHMGVFAALAGIVIARWYAVPAVAAIWVAIERTHGPLGFAWLALGNAGTDMSVPMRVAPYAGVYGLSFIFAMLSTALAIVLLNRSRRELLWLLALPLLFLLPSLPEAGQGAESAAVVQPNIDQDREWTADNIETTHRQLAYLSLQAALAAGEKSPGLIVWPEVPAPLYYYSDPRFRDEVTNLARLTGKHFLFGTVAFTQQNAPQNSALLLGPDGGLKARYDKIYLVPFGEFIPPFFSFINKITQEAGDYVAGEEVVVFPIGDHRAGTFICYESAFPHLVRQFAARGAEVLVNISNDGYFGDSAAREQHLKLVRMRAAENRRWVIRSTNNGITASVDPAGRLMQVLPANQRLADRLEYSYIGATTVYTRFGDWFVWLCAILAAAALIAARLPRYRTGD